MHGNGYPHVKVGPPKPGRVIEPYLFSMPPGTERHVVEGGSAILLTLEQGDRLKVENSEGGQQCEIVCADDKGHIDPGILNSEKHSPASGLQALLQENNPSMHRLLTRLKTQNINLSQASAIHLFEHSTPAKTTAEFTAQRNGTAIIAAPGGIMDFQKQNTATPLILHLQRHNIRKNMPRLPEPLADPVSDTRVQSATAQAYHVKAGDYLQIIDVEGRQCTDFQCFATRKLDKGIEHALDATTTRSLMEQAYPMPGLHAKYYDQDMLPLVEVIQDNCGRHDAFALACTAKYYDDLGYPGHVNCSDNFNSALEQYGVASRKGWMAINFFFNTSIDEHGSMISDEPWSRPGDYVLLRALTDLVCVSSACPDDTSPANGWNPSDIHIRTYSGKEKFQRAIAFRHTPNSEPKMTKQTGFHNQFSRFTKNFVEYNGFWLPNCMSSAGPIEEYYACREQCVVMDLSALRKFEVTGPDSEALCQYVFTRNIKKLPVGGVVYTAMCYPHGGMIDDGTVFRLGKDNFRWIGGSDYGGDWLREKAAELQLNVLIRSSTNMQHNISVQGPESRNLLKKMLYTAPDRPEFKDLEWFRFTPARINDDQGIPIVVSRTGYTGELGYEIFCHPKQAEHVFDAVWENGQEYGLKPLGLEALDMLRIEAGLVFAGYDFCDQTDPFEAGIGFTVPLKSKPDDFIGRDALIRRKENPARKLIGLDIDSNIDVHHGDCLHIGRAQIGEITSSMRSPILNKNIALARVDVAHHDTGTKVEVGKLDGHQKRLPATITPFPHFDPQKKRPRS